MIKRKSKNKKTSKHRRKLVLFSKRKGTDGKFFVSLRVKFALVMIVSALVVVGLAVVLIPVAVNLITNFYMEPERMNARLDDYIKNFSDYVADEKVTSDDAEAVVRWSMFHRNVHLVVFGSEDAQLGVFDGEILDDNNIPELEDPIFTENISVGAASGNTYMVRFSDRVCSVSIMDYSGGAVYNGVHVAGVLVAGIIFFLVILVYYHIQTEAIMHLSAEVETVSGGDLSAPIFSKRNDEIGGLARDVDNMRSTILQKMQEEKEIREANSDLITSMSHDIRTPLTTLMGYMELLQNDSDSMTEEQKNYVRLCAEKAEQIKELSDKLFLYFWAHHIHNEGVDVEPCDIGLMWEQVIGEWLLPMETEGFTLKIQESHLTSNLRVAMNAECLRRIIDNIFDNIRKYAHRDHPIEVSLTCIRGGREVCITFKNTVGHPEEKTSGTHIGHKTCANMAELMGGRFDAHIKGSVFEASLYLKIIR